MNECSDKHFRSKLKNICGFIIIEWTNGPVTAGFIIKTITIYKKNILRQLRIFNQYIMYGGLY